MNLATVISPMSDENLQLAAQCGVTDLVDRYHGSTLEELTRVKRRAESFGLRLSVIEGYLPIENIKLGLDDGRELEALKSLIRSQGEAGVPILCYNFMAGTDWVRTRLDAPERGGARVTAFDLADAQKAILLNQGDADPPVNTRSESIGAAQLWDSLERLLNELVPVAEECGVTLAMHPDDPPLPEFQGKARIMNSVESFERLIELVPSSANSVCFCQGSFAEMGVDLLEAIHRLGEHISYVHCRDVRGTGESFTETFHDNGPTDMAACINAYREAGFEGPIRPDHVPQLAGEEEGEPGYTMRGRLFAYGYLRGLMHGVGTPRERD